MNKKDTTRPSWDEYFMEISSLVAKRATCTRRKVGAVFVKGKQILCSGYNGAPANISHCTQTGCLREKLNVPSGEKHELCRGVHAEQNAIIQAAYHGIQLAGAVLYCTNRPCSICAKMLVNAGIKTVYYKDGYNDELATQMFEQGNIELIQIKP